MPATVAILMGSANDHGVMKPAEEVLDSLGIAHDVRVISAHRTPDRLIRYLESAEENGVEVVICGAGGTLRTSHRRHKPRGPSQCDRGRRRGDRRAHECAHRDRPAIVRVLEEYRWAIGVSLGFGESGETPHSGLIGREGRKHQSGGCPAARDAARAELCATPVSESAGREIPAKHGLSP